jgi:hypothetical protein
MSPNTRAMLRTLAGAAAIGFLGSVVHAQHDQGARPRAGRPRPAVKYLLIGDILAAFLATAFA